MVCCNSLAKKVRDLWVQHVCGSMLLSLSKLLEQLVAHQLMNYLTTVLQCVRLYSRQARVLGFQRYSVERSSASRHISAVTRDFQTALPSRSCSFSLIRTFIRYLTHIAYYYLCIYVDLALTLFSPH